MSWDHTVYDFSFINIYLTAQNMMSLWILTCIQLLFNILYLWVFTSTVSSLLVVILGLLYIPASPPFLYLFFFLFFPPICFELAMSTLKQQICSSCLCRFHRVDRNTFSGEILVVPDVNHLQELLLNGNFSEFFMTISVSSSCGSWRKILQACSNPLYLWQNQREESFLLFSFLFGGGEGWV